MQHTQFVGHNAQYHSRDWMQSPDTYSDVQFNSDAHGRTFQELVADMQIRTAYDDMARAKQYGSNSRTGESKIRAFDKLKPLMQWTPFAFNDMATYQQWEESEAIPFFMNQAHKNTSKSDRYSKDLHGYLVKWMKLHSVNPQAIEQFSGLLRKVFMWLGDNKAPSTKQRKQTTRVITDEMHKALMTRLMNLRDDPNAKPLYACEKKRGKYPVFGENKIQSLIAAYFIGMNITARSGEIQSLKVGDIDFNAMTISRPITKISAGNYGEVMVEKMWPETAKVVADYIAGRRLEKERSPDAKLFGGKLEMAWRSLTKDVFADKWDNNMGLHFFSRNLGVQQMYSNGATVAEICSATGHSISSMQEYADGADQTQLRANANHKRHQMAKKNNLLMDEFQQVMADANLRQFIMEMKCELAALTPPHITPAEPAVYNVSVKNGEYVDTPIEYDNSTYQAENVGGLHGGSNPSLGAKMQQLLENIQTKANDAIADWMEGNTKSALDLLKEIGGAN
jgi:integrase